MAKIIDGMTLEVSARRLISADIVLIDLARSDGGDLPDFAAGAHIDVAVTDGIVRQYSLCNRAAARGSYQIAVLREENSRGGSAAVHDAFVVGRQVTVGRPRNLFPLSAEGSHSILIGGGIGITPIIAMAETLAAAGRSFELHYCCRAKSDAAFAERVADMGGQLYLSRETGRFDAAAVIGPSRPGNHIYVCGPAAFMDSVYGAALAGGWPEEVLHRELFSATPSLDGDADEPFEICLESTGACFIVPPGISVAAILAANGVDVPVSCEQGICGTCLTPVLSGVPDHRDSYLTDAERERGDCFTPCCSRALTPRLTIGL